MMLMSTLPRLLVVLLLLLLTLQLFTPLHATVLNIAAMRVWVFIPNCLAEGQ